MPAYGTGVVAVDGLGERGDVADVVEEYRKELVVGKIFLRIAGSRERRTRAGKEHLLSTMAASFLTAARHFARSSCSRSSPAFGSVRAGNAQKGFQAVRYFASRRYFAESHEWIEIEDDNLTGTSSII